MAIDLVHQHLDYLRRKNCSPRTRHDREGALRRLAAYLDKPLVEATAEDLDGWQSSLRVSISAIATYTSHVASFYRWALEQGHIDSDPATLLPRPGFRGASLGRSPSKTSVSPSPAPRSRCGPGWSWRPTAGCGPVRSPGWKPTT